MLTLQFSLSLNRIREHREQQDSLLLFVRKLLSSQSLFSKCVGIIGAVAIIEVICKRDSSLKNIERDSATCLSLNEDDVSLFSYDFGYFGFLFYLFSG